MVASPASRKVTPMLQPRTASRSAGAPILAIVVDDLGPAVGLTRRAIGLPVPVTLAFLPYADDLDGLTAAAQRRGHEIFLHLPMDRQRGCLALYQYVTK